MNSKNMLLKLANIVGVVIGIFIAGLGITLGILYNNFSYTYRAVCIILIGLVIAGACVYNLFKK